MDKLIELLFREPLLLLVVGAWVFGLIGNATKAKKKRPTRTRAPSSSQAPSTQAKIADAVQKPVVDRRAGVALQPKATRSKSRAAQTAQPAPPAPAARRRPVLAGSSAQTPEQIAQEMRRVLGLDAGAPRQPAAQASLAKEPDVPPIPRQRQRAPGVASPAAAKRRLQTRVDPHVGERIRDRHMEASKVGASRAGRGAIGGLGGRVQKQKRAAVRASRYSLDDLRKAVVINEILSPPVSLRPHEERRPG
ncbi:MAG: hypothetical protein CMJ88_04975 [Planctomycetes bacterium]|nr:hypothetical protein [Planctomycetota bacterium]